MSFSFFRTRHRTADGAASAVGVAVRRRWHRQNAAFKALSTVLVVLDCSGIFEKKKNSPKLNPFCTRSFKGFFHQVIFRSRAKRLSAIGPLIPHAPRAGRPRRMRLNPQNRWSGFCATPIQRNHHDIMICYVVWSRTERLNVNSQNAYKKSPTLFRIYIVTPLI